MIWKPKIGQKVRLSSYGYKTVHGCQTREEITADVRGFSVVRVSKAHTIPECWSIEVDGPFSRYLLTSIDVEPYKETT